MTDTTESGYSKARQEWDAEASHFDDEPDHGLRDPQVLREWTDSLRKWLPAQETRVLDVGCGTGSLSAVLAGLGHDVTGVDFAPQMLALARVKTAGLARRPSFCVMDASRPALAPGSFDIVLGRHVLWALPNRSGVLERWAELLRPGGRMLLIEGHWATGAGVRANDLLLQLPRSVSPVAIEMLSGRPELWGKEVADERYAIIADRAE